MFNKDTNKSPELFTNISTRRWVVATAVNAVRTAIPMSESWNATTTRPGVGQVATLGAQGISQRFFESPAQVERQRAERNQLLAQQARVALEVSASSNEVSAIDKSTVPANNVTINVSMDPDTIRASLTDIFNTSKGAS